MKRPPVLLLLSILVAGTVAAQPRPDRRPIPYPLIPSPQLAQAMEKGTRTTTGQPGPNYWMNEAAYTIEASLDPKTSIVSGTSQVVYRNNSPDALPQILVHLHQNVYAPGVVRNRMVEVTGGVDLKSVSLNGSVLTPSDNPRQSPYSVRGTILTIRLPEPLAPGASTTLGFAWSFRVPDAGTFRNGTDGEAWYVAYWYPQVAVYDDVNGWKADPYMGEGEFYADFASFDVKLTVPEGFTVAATGTLENASDVWSEQSVARLEAAVANPEAIVRVVDEEDLGQATQDAKNDRLTWHFRADRVRDFAWGTSARYLVDATVAETGAGSSMIYSFWRPGTGWERSAEFVKFTIEYLSRTFFPYPYPHMTAVEGPLGGGMEYPMMTLIGRSRSERGLFGVTFHETAHMYFPMIVATDEKENTWMDEGLTSFNTAEGEAEFWGEDPWPGESRGYLSIAGTGMEYESRRHADRYPVFQSARGIAAYTKPAVALHALRGIVGNDVFYKAFREYANRWAWKHPQPEDLFNTFEDVVGEDLDWFWRTMFYETWTLDHAIASVVDEDGQTRVTVRDEGLSPFPVLLRATYADGTTSETRMGVEAWMAGHWEQSKLLPRSGVVKVELDPGGFLPDVKRDNNIWTK